MFNSHQETQTQLNENKIKELAIRLENLEKESELFFRQLNITSDQLSAFVANKNNFTEENWQELMKQKQALDDKLKRELDNIRNPKKTKKSYANLHVERHWLQVR